MISNPPAIMASSPLLDGYNSAGCSVYEFPLPPPPGTGKQLRHQESLVAISSRNLNLPPRRQGCPAIRGGRTLAVDWDAASDWSWDAESCISTMRGRTLRNKASNATLSLQHQSPRPITNEVPSKAKRRQTMVHVQPPPQPAPPMVPSRNPQASLFASTSMPERNLGDRTSFLLLDDDSSTLEAPSPPFAQPVVSNAKPFVRASRLVPSSSMPEMKGGVLGEADDTFFSEVSTANNHLRPNRQTMIPTDPENRCSAFDRFEVSIAKLRAHAPSPSPLGKEEPAMTPSRAPPCRPMDRHTYSPASQPRVPDASTKKPTHKSRWRDTPLPIVPPDIGTLLKGTEHINPSPRLGTANRPRSNTATPRSMQTTKFVAPPLLPSPALPIPGNTVLSNGRGRVPASQKRSPEFMSAPSVPAVLTSFMNMSPEQRIPSQEGQDRSTKMKKLLRKASVIGWWKKKGKGKEGS
ncbi:hypothetical protein OE88DRAFT_1806021 [Heliocybe sulcata]|uniref:Uncharacterized protein n=1 Tax=Heliocybe sulcata TaxID=5364 RepID=A0A5C3N8S4_9AGAM|nr:hypothetical protein OE88DRAFT_1806021 [Heliocybe sulcata]